MPDLSFKNLKPEFVAPRDATEELIATVWSEVLGLDEIGIWDNFFELGGHSLRATQVLSRINAIFKIELPLAAVFAHSTVAGLAAVIEDHLVDQLESMPEDEAHQFGVR
jgi:acyl carrier protein